MAFVPIAIMAVSAAVAAYGAIKSSQAQAANAKSQQAAANYNATVEKQNADASMAAASANERAQRMQNDQQVGLERARVAESGGGYTGTNVGALAQNGANLELGALNTRYGGMMAARGLLAQSTLSEYQGQVAGMNAKSDIQGGYISAASAALGAASSYGKSSGSFG